LVNANGGKKNHLAIGLFVGAHSSILTYAFVSTRDGKIIGAQTVRRQMFMYTALGHWPSLVNPKRENLLLKNGIDTAFLVKNEYDEIIDSYCPSFDQLWKVRFYEHPYEYDLEGWSHGQYKPSAAQIEFLASEYGVKNVLTDYIYGDNLYKLLRDVRNQAWISKYRALPRDPVVSGP